jgi:predicted RNA-binding Zn-ribbon protein involved in translation (DUF1610 family)
MRLKVFLSLLLFLVTTALPTGDAQTCSSSDDSSNSVPTATYYCPNCGGIQVNDCLSECVGYASANMENLVCFDRILFHQQEVVIPGNKYETFQQGDETTPIWSTTTYYFSYLWNDLFGMVVWFVTAGVAIAAGVGGGKHNGLEILF